MRLIERTSKCEEHDTYFRINGRLVPGTLHKVKIKKTPLAVVLRRVLGDEGAALLEKYKAVTLYTVGAKELAGDGLMPEVLPGQKIVGYELEFRTGATQQVLIEGIGTK
jgi:hypothetical protein